MEATVTLNQSNVHLTTHETIDDNGRDERHETCCDQDDQVIDPNPFQATLSKTSSYLRDLPRRRETTARKRDQIIPLKFMHILWFAGLRGAVTYAVGVEVVTCEI
jgi:hypothetical protein